MSLYRVMYEVWLVTTAKLAQTVEFNISEGHHLHAVVVELVAWISPEQMFCFTKCISSRWWKRR